MPIQSINGKVVDEYYKTLNKKTKSVVKRNRKPRSEYVTDGVIYSVHKILRFAFDQAVKWELIGKNPFPLANRPKQSTKNVIFGIWLLFAKLWMDVKAKTLHCNEPGICLLHEAG